MLCLSSQKNKHYTKDPSDVIVTMATILSSFNAVGLSNQPQIGTGMHGQHIPNSEHRPYSICQI